MDAGPPRPQGDQYRRTRLRGRAYDSDRSGSSHSLAPTAASSIAPQLAPPPMRARRSLAAALPVAATDSIRQLDAVAQAEREAAEATKTAAEAKKRLDPEQLIDAIVSMKSRDACAAILDAAQGVPDVQAQLVRGMADRLRRNATDDIAPPPTAVHAALASSAARLAVEMSIKAARERVAAAAAAAPLSSASAAQAEGPVAPATAAGIKSLLARPLRVLAGALGLSAAPAAPATAPCAAPAPSVAAAPNSGGRWRRRRGGQQQRLGRGKGWQGRPRRALRQQEQARKTCTVAPFFALGWREKPGATARRHDHPLAAASASPAAQRPPSPAPTSATPRHSH